jgi:hypothetical protein
MSELTVKPSASRRRAAILLPLVGTASALAAWQIAPLWSGAARHGGAATGGSAAVVPGGHDSSAKSLLSINPESVDLGKVPQGSLHMRTVWLENRRQTPVRIVSLTSSCECAQILLPTRTVLPGEKIAASVECDLAKEPDFSGGLSIDLAGQSPDGEAAFALRALLTVEKAK